MKRIRLLALASAALAGFTHPAPAAPGDLDITLTGAGKLPSISVASDTALDVATSRDGKIGGVSSAFDNFALVCHNGTGSLVSIFNDLPR